MRSVDHAIDVLEAMARVGGAVGVSHLARQTGLSKAAVYQILATFERRRFVIRDPGSTLYRLSWALYELGSGVVRDVDLSRTARPHLDMLARQLGESVLLGILDGDEVLYLDRGEAPFELRMVANTGRRGMLHATASGKVLLACSGDTELWDRLLRRGLRRMTAATITDPDRLRHDIAEVRQKGYATCWQEGEVGLCSVAVALRDYTGATVGCLTVAGPSTRLTTGTLQAHLAPLRAAAHSIETHLGARHAPARSAAQPFPY